MKFCMVTCMVTTFYPPYHFGGEAVYVQQLANDLAERGHEVHIIHCRDSFELQGQAPRPSLPEHQGVTVHTLRSPWRWLSPLVTQQSGRMGLKKKAIEQIIRDENFDVIHSRAL